MFTGKALHAGVITFLKFDENPYINKPYGEVFGYLRGMLGVVNCTFCI